MALKPGKIYQEMVEVEDEPRGLGCFAWFIIILIILGLIIFTIGFFLEHMTIFVICILGIIFIFIAKFMFFGRK